MKKIIGLSLYFMMTAGLLMTGCNKKQDNNTLALLMASMPGPATTVYRGSSPEGNFMELIVDRKNKTVTISNYTSGDVNLGPYDYVNLPHDNAQAGGFTILNRADVGDSTLFPGGGYLLFSEVPGEAVVAGAFDSSDVPFCGPTIGVAVDTGDKSQYYSTTYNIMHVIADFNAGEPYLLFGFAAFDSAASTPLDGRLWGAEFNNRDEDAYPLGDGSFGVGSLVKDTVSGAWVDWGTAVGEWDDAVALLGNHGTMVEMVFGDLITGMGGGGLAMPQAGSANFNASRYPGTYAAIAYEYNFTGDTMDVSPYTAVITSDGKIQLYAFGTSTMLFSLDLISFSTYTPYTDPFYTASGIEGSSDPGIRSANNCKGMFFASAAGILVYVMFDPHGKSAGFILFAGSDLVAFGLAIKDKNFVSP